MKLQIPYSSNYLTFDISLPKKNITILRSKDPLPTKDLESIVKDALKTPIERNRISEIARSGYKVALMFDDWTRPTPVSKIAPIILEELRNGGVKNENIVLVCGNGMHDPNYMTDERLIQKLGKNVFNKYEIILHDAYDYEKLEFLGVSERFNTPLFINKHVAEADFKISIGRIVPHVDVGYSGGAKMIMPGVADIWGIIHNHSGSFPHIGTLRNPLREDIDECGQMAGLDFILNVVHNSKKKILKAFAGDPVQAHRKGVEFGDQEVWGAKITEKAEIVIISPGLNNDAYFMEATHCLDLANKCLAKGGTIILVASCSRGWSKPQFLKSGWGASQELLEYDYPELLRLVSSRAWHKPTRQFQALVYYVQHVAKTCFEKDVVLVGSKGFSKKNAQRLGIRCYESIDSAINNALKKHGEQSKAILIPNLFTLPLKHFHKADYN